MRPCTLVPAIHTAYDSSAQLAAARTAAASAWKGYVRGAARSALALAATAGAGAGGLLLAVLVRLVLRLRSMAVAAAARRASRMGRR
jgi:hypothetical protein